MIDNSNMTTVFSLLGGLALFIFGMQTMTGGLKDFAGTGLRHILSRATRNRLKGMGLGTVIGFLVQSSAATVMMVGFIHAGLMTLTQSVPVMLGANIGTTLSMQLISFKLSDYCLPAIALGVLIRTARSLPRIRSAGTALMGFGFLFLGMSTMSESIAPHREAFIPVFSRIDGSSASGLVSGILLATLITGIIQSSGAVIGITFALIKAGVITNLSGAFPIIIGANIGTCVTALLGSIGTHIDARRSAVSHLLFNIFSTTIAALTAPYFLHWIPLLGGDLIHQAANANTIKMVLTALLILPFAPIHAKVVRFITPSRKKVPAPSFLDAELIPRPEQALQAAMRELRRMTELCRESLSLDEQLLEKQNTRAFCSIEQNEKTLNAVKLAISDYLTQITSRFLSRRQAVLVQHIDRCMTEIERIGDHLTVLSKLNRKIATYSSHAFFAPCRNQLKELYRQTNTLLELLSKSLDPEHKDHEGTATVILDARREFVIQKDRTKQLIQAHVGQNEMPPRLGIYLNEYQMTFSKIARHCKTIAGAQKSPFFWLKEHKLNRIADPYTEKEVLNELDDHDFFDEI